VATRGRVDTAMLTSSALVPFAATIECGIKLVLENDHKSASISLAIASLPANKQTRCPSESAFSVSRKASARK